MREKRLLTCKDSGYLPPFLLNRKLEAEEVRFVLPQKVQVIEYYSLSDGCRRVYEDGDGMAGYGEKLILPPMGGFLLQSFHQRSPAASGCLLSRSWKADFKNGGCPDCQCNDYPADD